MVNTWNNCEWILKWLSCTFPNFISCLVLLQLDCASNSCVIELRWILLKNIKHLCSDEKLANLQQALDKMAISPDQQEQLFGKRNNMAFAGGGMGRGRANGEPNAASLEEEIKQVWQVRLRYQIF